MTTPADPAALLRSRGYVQLLAFAAILGVPISAAVYGFLALASYLQKEVYTHLPHGLGFNTVPVWWPLPMLLAGGVIAALAIQYLPGRGGPSPADGFKLHGPPAGDGPPRPGRYWMTSAAIMPPISRMGSGHQTGTVLNPSPCGRWL